MPAIKGREIRQRRQRLGIKLAEFSELTRTNIKTIANIESRDQITSIEVVYRFAKVLGCEAEDLLADPDRIAA
jgi:transcriptional regulator with XRE-family HTH domain